MNDCQDFYHRTLGLAVHRVTDDWAELQMGGHVSISNNSNNSSLLLHIQAATVEAQLSTASSPLLTLQVEDMDDKIAAAAQAGAHLDGPIQYPAYGKVAVLRAPDGHMIALFEPVRES
jgi:catechol 2,3-dioxygenase-like lactoylglutathione lyase family enzyme